MSLRRVLPKLPKVLIINDGKVIFTKYVESISITGQYLSSHIYQVRMVGADLQNCCAYFADKSDAKDYPIIDEYFKPITEKKNEDIIN